MPLPPKFAPEYTRTTVINNNVVVLMTMGPEPTQFNFCLPIQMYLNRVKLRIFVLKVAISGPHLTFL